MSELKDGKEEDFMAALTGYKAVAVIKENGKDYHYAIYEDGNDYEIADYVFVTNSQWKDYCEIKKIDHILTPEESAQEFTKGIVSEVVGKADEYVWREDRRKQAQAVKKKMEAMAKKIDAEKKYEFYAKENADFGALYKEYKELLE